MDDREIRRILRSAMGDNRAVIKSEVLEELRFAPIDLFNDLPELEKTIALTAFMAAAAATQNASEESATMENSLDVFLPPPFERTGPVQV